MRAAVPVLLLALGTACGRDGGTEVPVPATVSVAPGTVTLSALGASQALTATVRDQRGNVLTGQGVTWASTNTAVASVNSSGVVTGEGNGTATIRATAGGVEGTATVTVAQVVAALVKAAGDAQTGTVATALPIPLVVRANDANGHPVAGVAVTLSVTQGGGTLSAASQATGPGGETGGATWTLGTGAGAPQQVTASAAGVSPGTFTATATAGLAARISLAAGDGQSAAAGSAVPISPSVLVQDGFDNPVAGVAVTFTITGGGGSVTGGNATTNASGVAAVGSWTLGTTVGTANNTLAATSAGLTGSPVTFTASVLAGAAASVAAQAGANQTGPSGLALPVDPAVIVRDGFANPVPGAIVTFAATQGGGSVTGAVDTTGANGVATVGDWILGAPGTNQLTATVTGSGIAGNPVTFTATATGGAGDTASVAVFAGDGQTGLVGFAVNVPPAVIVRDGTNAPLANVQVTFAVTGGGGQVTGGSVTTGPDGVARVGSWVLGAAAGANTLSASVAAAGFAGNPVAFTATGATQQYDIEVRFLTAVTAAQQEAFDSAEARWERALYGELTDVTFNRGPGTCAGVQIPGVHETIDDLVIFVRLDSIDGPLKVLGSAGPCFIRGSDTITVMGAMQFDTADVAQFLDEGLFDEIVMHEMGHVIGFGTLWSLRDRLQDPVLSGGTDPHFDGPEAIAAFDRSGGADYSLGAKVPVEDNGGPGTADAHWRESVFDNELMTGFLNSGVTNPLSVVSVASLADVGYLRANYAAADPYALGGAALRAGLARRIPLGPDAYLGVVTFVDAQGRPRATVRLRP